MTATLKIRSKGKQFASASFSMSFYGHISGSPHSLGLTCLLDAAGCFTSAVAVWVNSVKSLCNSDAQSLCLLLGLLEVNEHHAM